MTAPSPSTDSLVAEPNGDVRALEGAGAASSWDDLNSAWASPHPDMLQIAFATAGAGLDSLDAVMDPVGALGTAGIGWLIEHVAFLREPLDALAGDPAQITAQAQTWHNVATELAAVAGRYRGAAASAAADWEGAGSDAYTAAVADYTARLDDAAGRAERLSSVILLSGAGVGTVRSLIRDWIADLVWEFVCAVVVLGLAAFVTFGGSLAAGTVGMIVRAIDLANDIARRISELLDTLSDAGQTVKQLVDAMRDTVAQARAAAPGLRASAQDLRAAAESVRADKIIETGKQITGAGQSRLGWDDPPGAPAG
ncbi:MAG: PPE domain-containing protein [Pseudonocardia sp.]|nr:PPE domain-containing protein [Pseudonocardia sp.]